MMTLEIRMKPHDDVKDKIRFEMIAENFRRFGMIEKDFGRFEMIAEYVFLGD